MLFDGQSIVRTPPRERVDRIGYVGQDPLAGFVTDTVEEELAYGMEQLGLPGPTMRRRVEETLDLLGIADLRSRDLRTLSGGQQQRVAIGSVLTMHPRLLVLDEPTSALDPTAAEDVLATLTRLVHDAGLSVLLAEHRLERVLPFADRIALLTGDGGLLVGEPAQVLPHSPVVPPIVELGRAAGWEPLPLTVRDARRRTRDLTLPARARPCSRQPTGEVRLEATGVSVAHGRILAVRDVDLRLHAGDDHGADGAQRVGQVDVAVDPAGHREAPRTARSRSTTRGRPSTRPRPMPPSDARSSGWCPQTAADLLYLETVDAECAAADEGAAAAPGTLPRAARRAGAGPRRATAPARPVRGPAARPGAGDRAHRAPRHRAARRADARARLPRQGAPRRAPARPGRRQGHAIVVATHDVEFVAQVADDVVVLAEGEVVSSGPVRRVVAESPAFAPQVTKILGSPWLRVDERRPARRVVSAHPAVPLRPRSLMVLGVASVAGLMMLTWPLLLKVPDGARMDPPFLFLALLPLVVVVVLAEVSEGGMDARVLAILGVLSAINAVLRALSAGVAGRRAGVLPADPRRAGLRARLRLRARLHVAVRVGAADRRRRTVAAVPDDGVGVGRDGRRVCCRDG